jgi:hypothetical protein
MSPSDCCHRLPFLWLVQVAQWRAACRVYPAGCTTPMSGSTRSARVGIHRRVSREHVIAAASSVEQPSRLSFSVPFSPLTLCLGSYLGRCAARPAQGELASVSSSQARSAAHRFLHWSRLQWRCSRLGCSVTLRWLARSRHGYVLGNE